MTGQSPKRRETEAQQERRVNALSERIKQQDENYREKYKDTYQERRKKRQDKATPNSDEEDSG